MVEEKIQEQKSEVIIKEEAKDVVEERVKTLSSSSSSQDVIVKSGQFFYLGDKELELSTKRENMNDILLETNILGEDLKNVYITKDLLNQELKIEIKENGKTLYSRDLSFLKDENLENKKIEIKLSKDGFVRPSLNIRDESVELAPQSSGDLPNFGDKR